MNLNMNNTPKIKDIQKNEDMKLKFNPYQNIQEKENSNKNQEQQIPNYLN